MWWIVRVSNQAMCLYSQPIQVHHPSAGDLHQLTIVCLITSGKTVVVKGLIFSISTYICICTLALTLTEPLIPDSARRETYKYLRLLL